MGPSRPLRRARWSAAEVELYLSGLHESCPGRVIIEAGAGMNDNRKRRGFSLIELMIVIAIILIIATIALPKLNRAKMYAHETAAIKTIQTIHTAQTQYQSQFGRFATSLAELGPPQSGQPGPQSADLIDTNLAGGEESGHKVVGTGRHPG